MELQKQPETEMEYWGIIEELGGFIWSMNHGLAHGRIQDSSGGIDRDIQDARRISAQLVSELGEKFGVIPPQDCPKVESGQEPPPAPEGKTYYWDWYKKMKELAHSIDYEKIICSACPFGEGVEKMISLGGMIPCGAFRGSLYKLKVPHICGMLTTNIWGEEELRQEIVRKGGEIALVRFKIKEAGLKALFDPKTGELKI
jgi:hypothetical protein